MIGMVFENLMGNTVRHSEEASMVTVSCEESDERLVIRWEDGGIGVPEGMKEKIFRRGEGADSGLGLFLCREILGITGLTMRETGAPGKGACFELTIPSESWRRA